MTEEQKTPEKEPTVYEIMVQVIDTMCEEYCKYPDMPKYKEENKLYDERCAKCPLNRLC